MYIFKGGGSNQVMININFFIMKKQLLLLLKERKGGDNSYGNSIIIKLPPLYLRGVAIVIRISMRKVTRWRDL